MLAAATVLLLALVGQTWLAARWDHLRTQRRLATEAATVLGSLQADPLKDFSYIARTSGDTTSHRQSRRYWSVALLLDATGVLLFALFFLITEIEVRCAR